MAKTITPMQKVKEQVKLLLSIKNSNNRSNRLISQVVLNKTKHNEPVYTYDSQYYDEDKYKKPVKSDTIYLFKHCKNSIFNNSYENAHAKKHSFSFIFNYLNLPVEEHTIQFGAFGDEDNFFMSGKYTVQEFNKKMVEFNHLINTIGEKITPEELFKIGISVFIAKNIDSFYNEFVPEKFKINYKLIKDIQKSIKVATKEMDKLQVKHESVICEEEDKIKLVQKSLKEKEAKMREIEKEIEKDKKELKDLEHSMKVKKNEYKNKEDFKHLNETKKSLEKTLEKSEAALSVEIQKELIEFLKADK